MTCAAERPWDEGPGCSPGCIWNREERLRQQQGWPTGAQWGHCLLIQCAQCRRQAGDGTTTRHAIRTSSWSRASRVQYSQQTKTNTFLARKNVETHSPGACHGACSANGFPVCRGAIKLVRGGDAPKQSERQTGVVACGRVFSLFTMTGALANCAKTSSSRPYARHQRRPCF